MDLGKLRLAIGLVNGWLSALKWEQFWGVKAGGSQSTEALASVTTVLRYIFRSYIIYAPNHLGVNLRLP